jgi:hypothetical protein
VSCCFAQSASQRLYGLSVFLKKKKKNLKKILRFLGCLDLCAKLYPDVEALEIPDFSSCYDVVKLGPAYLWVHIMRRAKLENVSVAWNTPFCLTHMMDFLLTAIDRAVGQPGFPGCHMKWEHAAIVNCFISMPAMKDQVVASKMDVSIYQA